jgi:hypothetical protein
LPKVKELATFAANGVRSVSCLRREAPPFAVSADGKLGAFFGSAPLRALADGSEPKFVTPRLRAALQGAQSRGCELTMDQSRPHGSGLACDNPVAEFNKLLTAVEPPVELGALGEPQANVAVGGQPVRLQALCEAANEKVVAVGRAGKVLTVYTVAADEGLQLAACTAEEEQQAEECYRSGGTCVHDVQCVPQPTVWPMGTVTRVTLK